MRILFIVPYMELGGTERHVSTLASGLMNTYECDVAVLAPNGPAVRQFAPDRIRFAHFPRLDRGLASGIAGFRRAFGQILESWVPDVIHVHAGAELLVLARFGLGIGSSLRKRTALVFTVHGYHGPRAYLDYRLAALLGKLADRLICVSGDEEKALASAGTAPGRLLRIYNGVRDPLADPDRGRILSDLETDYPGLGSSGTLIGTVARLEKPKGIDVLIRAFAVLKSRNGLDDLKLLIVGSGSEETRLKSLAAQLGLPGSELVFTGYEARAQHLMSFFDISVIPSLQEPFGLVCAEAMANNRPVVATTVGGIPEIVVDEVTGILVPPGDPDRLVEALRTLIQNPELRRKMGQNGRRRYEQMFSDHSMVESTFNCYCQILKARRNAVEVN